ncbi:hypothetical protein [Legionella fairfieldensis]|uniref:hypothetical protein n=1 Tax=Legionella fairfieldensis TaxID=45064 RepID=UPI00048F98EF|nr:hypothetical protein [Legionella fairfieldensis]
MLRLTGLIFAIIMSFYSYAEDTELKLYRPFSDETPVIIKEEKSGQCWQQSHRIKREDAWRCVVETRIYDPCFVKQYGSQKKALCPQSPWTSEGIVINLPAPVDNSRHIALDMSKTYPWAIELTTGEKCEAVDEGESQYGLQIRYHCNNQTMLVGHVQRCEAKWRILQRSDKGIATAEVARAWF